MEKPVRVQFGDYKPDLSPLANDGLAVAKNTVPIPHGYNGINSLSNVAGFTALSERAKGAIAGIDEYGSPYNFVGTATKLYGLIEQTVDMTRLVGGAYTTDGEGYWEFADYGGTVIATNGSDRPQYINLDGSVNFSTLGNPTLTNTKAPIAKHIGVVGSFVVLGNTVEAPNQIHWSAVDDPFNWPTPGTEVSAAVLSDSQILKGAGGAVQRIISGAEVAAIFQERAIWRAEFRGGDDVFDLDRVEPERGLLIPSVAVPIGRKVFYVAEDGFYLFDYTTSTPIGRGIVDETFLADVDTSLFHRVSAVSDPDSQRIWILYPGSGHLASGAPNKVLIYDWGLNRWSHGELTGDNAVEWLTWAVHASNNLDFPVPGTESDPDAAGESVEFPEGGVDGISTITGDPLGSFDDRVAAPGALRLGAYSDTHFLQEFAGSGLPAVLETGRRELIPGFRALAVNARTMIDGVNPKVSVAGVRRTNDSDKFTTPRRIDDDGEANIRKDARYHKFRVDAPSGFSNALYMDVYCQRSGTR